MQPLRSPTAESCNNLRLNAISQSNSHIKIIVVNVTLYLTTSLRTNKNFLLVRKG